MAAKRAYGREDKQVRRAAILHAAAALYGDGLGDLPTVNAIADASGLAKGTVYLYFHSKEAIFSALLLDGWGKVVGLVEDAFTPSIADRDSSPTTTFLAAYVGYLDQHRELLRLDALRPVLERGLDLHTLADFKQAFVERLVAGGALIDQGLKMKEGKGIKLLTRTHALTCGLWQSLGSGPPSGITADAGVASAVYPEFIDELTEALTEFWRGALIRLPSD